MRPIDEKIVRMTLDNAKFKDRVKDTIKSFDSINKGAGSIGKGFNLSKIAEGISSIERKFSATGVAIATIVSNVTNQIIGFGKRIAGAVLDPLIEGGKTRALNIEKAKFQFEGLGMDVEATMASALEAVKGTAYGLDEAAVVASQFGASGMKAGDDMTESLRGISGVASMTGGSYSDIGRIFTQVAGQGRLMGDQLLQLSGRGVNAAATLSKALGVSEAEVREMVTKGKIDFKTFSKAMSDAFGEHATKANETYTGSLSNMRAALARIGAAISAPSFQNKRDLFNAITPQIDALHDAITPLIEAWNELGSINTKSLIDFVNGIDFSGFVDLGGISNMVDSFWNIVSSGGAILKAIGEGFKNAFPIKSVEQLVSLTEGFKNFTKGLTISGESASKLSTIFQGAFSIFDSIFIIASKLGGALLKLIPGGLGGSVLDLVSGIAEMAISFNDSLKEGNILTKIIDKLGDGLGYLGEGLGKVIDSSTNFGSSMKDNLGSPIDWVRERLAALTSFMRDNFGGIIGWIGDRLTSLKDIVKEVASGFGVEEVIGGGFLAGLLIVITNVLGLFKDFTSTISNFSNGFSSISNSVDGFTGSIKSVLDGASGALEAFQSKVKYDNLLKIAIAVGILAVSLKLLEGIKTEDVVNGLAALGGSMAVLVGGFAVINKLKLTGGARASMTIIALSLAMLVMASALKKISDLNPRELATGIGGLIGITVSLSLAVIAISKLGGKIQGSSLKLIALATAILILAVAVERMSEIKSGDLFKAIGALGLIFAQLAIFLKLVNKAKFGVGSALGVLAVAGALHIMISAIEKINNIDTKALIKGLVVIAIILAQLAIFSKVASGGSMLAAGAGMILIAAAIRMLMGPITDLSKMSWADLAKGLGGMALALAAVALAAYAMTGAIGGAAALVVMALGLKMLMGPILAFAAMSWGDMIKAFVGLAGGLALLAGISMLLSPAVVPMLAFGAALAVMGLSVALTGAGVAAFGLGLATLATLSATSIAAIISALGLLIKGLAELIPATIKFVVEVGLALIDGIGQLVPPLIETIMNLIMTLLETIAEHLPDFIDLGVEIVIQLMDGIARSLGPLVDTGLELIIAFIDSLSDGIRDNGPTLISSVMELLGEIILLFITAGIEVINALFGWIPGVKESTAKIGSTAEKYVRDNFGAKEAGEDKGAEFSTALEGTDGLAEAAGAHIGESGIEGLDIDVTDVGKNFGSGFAKGIRSAAGSVWESAKGLAKKASDTVKGWLDVRSPSRVTMAIGEYFGDGLAIGIKDRVKQVGKGAKDLALSAKDNLNKFIDGFELPDDDSELHFKAVIDYETLDTSRFGSLSALDVQPNTSTTSNLITATKAELRQNGNNDPRESNINNSTVHNDQYHINVNANGTMSKSAVRKLAQDIQTELKNVNDMKRMSKGEGVVF